MHWHDTQVRSKKHSAYISRLMSIFNFVLCEMNDLLQQYAAKCQFQVRKVCIRKLEINKQKNHVDQVKDAIMKKKEYGKTTFGLFGSGRFTVKSHITYIHILKCDHVKEIKDTDQHTLTPVQPDDRSVLAGIIIKFINEKKIQYNERPHSRVTNYLLEW